MRDNGLGLLLAAGAALLAVGMFSGRASSGAGAGWVAPQAIDTLPNNPANSPLAYAAANVPYYLPMAAGLAPAPIGAVNPVAVALAGTNQYTPAQVEAANAVMSLYGFSF